MSPARILLADDHELFREGLVGLIDTQPDLEVVGQAGDGLEALTLARDLDPDLIVMDIKEQLTILVCDTMTETKEDKKHCKGCVFSLIKYGVCSYYLLLMPDAIDECKKDHPINEDQL